YRDRLSLAPLRRREPDLGSLDADAEAGEPLPALDAGPAEPAEATPPLVAAEKVIALRLIASKRPGFPGEKLILALRDAGLRHGRFGIFHYHPGDDDRVVQFSVASLVEPGSFDLTRLRESSYPGISLFMALPDAAGGIDAFDKMLEVARSLAIRLDGQLLDEQGSALSVQRQRYMREEALQYLHQLEAQAGERA
ncbi:MAG TPA: hypothetical protein ENK16_07310, partial [Chromatiales bacterium]|nr:hypothetical protein [Chromatiales bacterium]